jgi:hypothetical protein
VRCFAGGSAIDYVRYGEEAAGIAAECDDPALSALNKFKKRQHFPSGNACARTRARAQLGEQVDRPRTPRNAGFPPMILPINRSSGRAFLKNNQRKSNGLASTLRHRRPDLLSRSAHVVLLAVLRAVRSSRPTVKIKR